MKMTRGGRSAVAARPAGNPPMPRPRPGLPALARAAGSVRAAGPVRPGGPVQPAEHPETLVYGVVRFDGRRRRPRNVVVAFENAGAADEYAVRRGFEDYLVVPLSFLTPSAPG